MLKYHPYPANDGKHKYYIITQSGKKIKFGAYGMSDYTLHKDEARKQRYINRHKKIESKFWHDPDTASYWALKYLWSYPTKEEAYQHIKKELKRKGFI